MIKLRHDHAAWVAHCRAVQSAKNERVREDDGMSHGIIPFGAIRQWDSIERQRLTASLSVPAPARITGWDDSGVGLAVACPYCRQTHHHVVAPESWRPEQPLAAGCGHGPYHIKVPRP